MEYINPTREQLEGLLSSLPLEQPVTMLNLLRFHPQARYGDATDHGSCSGREAYGRYAAVARAKLAQLGAELIWNGTPQGILIGPSDQYWHQAFLVRYPSAEAFFMMLAAPDYQAATVHRTAALADARLIANHDAP